MRSPRLALLLLLAACGGTAPTPAPPPELSAAAKERLAAHRDPRTWEDLDTAQPGRRRRDGRTGIVFVRVPAGEFVMGSDTALDQCERPAHRVRISRDYLLAETELTVAQWRIFVRDFAGDPIVPIQPGPDDLPMPVSCQDALAFCAQFGYRLPTEAEWERACVGGLAVEQEPWQTEEGMRSSAWFHRNAGMRTHPVRQKQGNPFGLYDMLGNLWEWCDDDFDHAAYKKHGEAAVDPRTQSTGFDHVLRGGSWFSVPPASPRTRKSGGFAERTAFFGCRPACDAPAPR